MKITKRITSLALILAFAFTSLCTFTVSAAFSDVDEANTYYEAIYSLVDDGTINGYEDGTFKPENTITRAEFSKLLAIRTAPSAQTFTQTTTAFPDVAADHWANAYIAYAVAVGAVNGYPDGTFKPEAPVTYGEAVKMIICGMGYATAVDTTLTPWHKGYIDLAMQINLTKNAMSLGDNPANRGIVAQLIYNINYTRVIEQGANGQWGASDDSNKTYGDNKDNVQTAYGILLGVTDYSLNGASVGRNRVQIGNTIYELSGNLNMDAIKPLVGQQVEFAYNRSSVSKIVKRSGYNTDITIEPWQIVDVTDNYIEYYANQAAYDRDDSVKVSFAPNMYMIYNTQIVNPSDISAFDIETKLDIETGAIKLTSNDGNEKTAELATVESYKTYFANTPSTDKNKGVTTIYDRNNASDNISIFEDDAEGRVTRVTSKDGIPSASSLTAIVNKTVVSVAVPYGKTEGTSVIISTATVSGEVTELSDDFEDIVIGSENYEISPYYEKLIDNNTNPDAEFIFETGDNGKFYLDHLGRIVYFEKNANSDPYGLIVKYGYGNGIDGEDRIQIMTGSGKSTVFSLKSTVKVDGSSKSSDEAIGYLKDLAVRVSEDGMLILPVKYKASDAYITSIDTLTSMYSGAKFTFSKTGYTFKGTSGQFTAANSGTNKATVYVIPTNLGDIDKYKQYSPSSVEERAYNEVYAYEPVGTTNAKVVICFLSGTQTTDAKIYASSPVYMIEGTATGTEDGKTATIVYCRNLSEAVSGDAVKKYSTDSEMMEKLSELRFGDMVKFAEESNGEITSMKTVYVMNDAAGERRLTAETADSDGAKEYPGFKIFADSSDLEKYYQVILGTVHSIDYDNNTLNYVPTFVDNATDALDAPSYEGLTLTSSTVYTTIEKLGQKPAYVSKAITDIKGYADFEAEPEVGSEVLILIMNKKVKAVYIINNDYR